jgi:hypothetical protein
METCVSFRNSRNNHFRVQTGAIVISPTFALYKLTTHNTIRDSKKRAISMLYIKTSRRGDITAAERQLSHFTVSSFVIGGEHGNPSTHTEYTIHTTIPQVATIQVIVKIPTSPQNHTLIKIGPHTRQRTKCTRFATNALQARFALSARTLYVTLRSQRKALRTPLIPNTHQTSHITQSPKCSTESPLRAGYETNAWAAPGG